MPSLAEVLGQACSSWSAPSVLQDKANSQRHGASEIRADAAVCEQLVEKTCCLLNTGGGIGSLRPSLGERVSTGRARSRLRRPRCAPFEEPAATCFAHAQQAVPPNLPSQPGLPINLQMAHSSACPPGLFAAASVCSRLNAGLQQSSLSCCCDEHPAAVRIVQARPFTRRPV